MKLYTKILSITLPLILLSLLGGTGVTYILSRSALTHLAEDWLDTRLAEALDIAEGYDAFLHEYELQDLPASVRQAQRDAGAAMLEIEIGEQGYIYAVTATGRVVVHRDPERIGDDVSESAWFQEMQTHADGQLDYVWLNERHLAMYEHFAPWDWYVLATDPHDEVYGAINRSGIYVLALGCCGSLALGLLLMSMTRRLMVPLQLLTLGAERVGRGELDTRIAVRSDDELGHLGQAFNHMATRLQHTLTALRRSAEHFRALIENSSDIIVILGQDHSIAYASPSVERVLGYRPEELVGRGILSFIHPDDTPSAIETLTASLRHPESPLSGTQRIRHKDGSWHTMESTGSNLLDHPTIAGIILNSRDVSERAQAEAERERLLGAEREQRLLAETLGEVTRVLNGSLDREQVLSLILDQLARVLEYCSASVMLLRPDGRLEIAVQQGFQSPEQEFTALQIGAMPHVQEVIEQHSPQIISDTSADARWQLLPGSEYIRCWMGVPLLVQNRVIGLLNVDGEMPGCYTQRDAELAVAFANQAAVAVENARLFAAVADRVAELEALRQASLGLTSSLELQDVLEAILESALKLLDGAYNAHVFLYRAQRLTSGAVLWADGRRGPPVAEPRPDGLMYAVARKGQPIVVADMRTHPLFARAAFDWKGAIAGLPLKIGRRVVGVMNVSYPQPRNFSEAELRVLRLLADQAAIAIENARLYEETHRRASELSALIEIGRDISATLDLPTVLERIATHARDLLGADDSEVYLLGPEGDRLQAIVALGAYAEEIKASSLPLGQGIVGRVGQTGVAEIVNSIAQDPRTLHIDSTPQEDHALMCAPLIYKDRIMGVMALTRLPEQDLFEESDLNFLIGLARQAALAIENARLYATAQQRTEALARALKQQQELDRLKDEFIQNVSHELRTPLALIRGYAELIENGDLGEVAPIQKDPISVIARRARMLNQLVDDLTAILQAERRELERERVDVAGLMHSVAADFQVAAEQADVALVSQVEAGQLSVCGDAIRLRRVLDNLVGNALKFTTRGGTITLRAWKETSSVVLEVADTGMGIPENHLEHIFDRFYQVDGSTTRRYGGVGLGLALVKEIVTAHDGQVGVQSKPGEGSTFRITLPRLRDPMPGAEWIPLPLGSGQARGESPAANAAQRERQDRTGESGPC